MAVLDRPLEVLDAESLRAWITTFRDAVTAHMAAINRLNVYPVPDGDTGTNMARTLDAVVAELATVDGALDATCRAISQGSLMGARGNSGLILSQILGGLAGTIRAASTVDGSVVADALASASAGAYRAVPSPVEGTILTVARESAEAAVAAAETGADLEAVLRSARARGGDALARTPEMLPVLADAGVVDAGGAGYLLLLDAALSVVAGDPLPEPTVVDTAAAIVPDHAPTHDPTEMRYEVMYLLTLDEQHVGRLRDRLGSIGDSVVVGGSDGTWNCHVHTNDIGAAVEAALDLDGRPSRIRVTDLFEEVAEEHARREAALHEPVEALTCAAVAVASGPGLASLFRDLGVSRVVSGGQTLNPSTAELLSAVEAAPSDHVVVLPNNKNIVPVAQQLDSLTAKTVRVVPTRSMPEGLASLVVYDPEADADANADAMTGAADAVVTGEVTVAVRDAPSDVGQVRAGEWIGLVRTEGIVTAGRSVVEVATSLLDQLVVDGRELVTIVTGAEASQADTEAIVAWLDDERAEVDVEVHHGGQPLYPYLFGVE